METLIFAPAIRTRKKVYLHDRTKKGFFLEFKDVYAAAEHLKIAKSSVYTYIKSGSWCQNYIISYSQILNEKIETF